MVRGIRTIIDLFSGMDGKCLPFTDFEARYSLGKKLSLVLSSYQRHSKPFTCDSYELRSYSEENVTNYDLTCFPLDESNNINVLKVKSKYYLSTKHILTHTLLPNTE